MNTPDFLPSLTGSFAQPAAENPTVAMMEAVFAYHGIHWRYVNCEVAPENLESAVKGAQAMGWKGFNCSIPHKVEVIRFLDKLGESAQLIGAVNTVVERDGQWIGENTDGRGFVQAMRMVTTIEGKKVLLFGAGGAARAVAVEMALAGASEIKVVNRRRDRGEELVKLLNDRTQVRAVYHGWDGTFSVAAETDIVINATSIGLFPNVDQRLPIDYNSLLGHMIVADGIHNPPQTYFLKEAAKRGCQTVNGLDMLVGQGVIGVKYWTGLDVNAQVMREALTKVLGVY